MLTSVVQMASHNVVFSETSGVSHKFTVCMRGYGCMVLMKFISKQHNTKETQEK